RKTPLFRRRRRFVVSGGYAASDSSPPAKVIVKGPTKVIVVLYSPSRRRRDSRKGSQTRRWIRVTRRIEIPSGFHTTWVGLCLSRRLPHVC
ncbi:hypothetical protein, partial [Paraburkholderia sp. CI2]|uniref:hypothetical protein n=2 Tax=unclassified Paraburkholderia TaxID=2615204 RepID=UPI001C856593